MKRAGYHVYRSKRWQALRMEALRRDGFQCVQCETRGRLEVDHIKPISSRPDLSFDLGNLQSLCPSCHTKKTRIEQGRKPLDPEIAKWRKGIIDLQPK